MERDRSGAGAGRSDSGPAVDHVTRPSRRWRQEARRDEPALGLGLHTKAAESLRVTDYHWRRGAQG